MKNFFTVCADNGQDQTFDYDELGFEKDQEVTFKQVVIAMKKIGYSETGIVSIE